jgi:hypothetical protein
VYDGCEFVCELLAESITMDVAGRTVGSLLAYWAVGISGQVASYIGHGVDAHHGSSTEVCTTKKPARAAAGVY